jgi:hypothetical protein
MVDIDFSKRWLVSSYCEKISYFASGFWETPRTRTKTTSRVAERRKENVSG